MKQLSNEISLTKNARGCWDVDTTKGCAAGVINNSKGCYNECYAYKAFHRHGYDFSKTVTRGFSNKKHEMNLVSQINKIDMPFVRIGVTGDPSENWEHTLNICMKLSQCNMVLYDTYKKAIVIITKHWNNLNYKQLNTLSKLSVCVNTSISALDEAHLLDNRLNQYNRLKNYCKSVLRIVSCDFNLHNEKGRKLDSIQQDLFDNYNVLYTVLRVSESNKLVLDGIINIKKVKFLSKERYASVHNARTYFGECSKCPDMCGLNL